MSDTNNKLRKAVILGHSGYAGHRLFAHLKAQHPNLEIIGLSSQDVDLTNRFAVDGLKDIFDDTTAVIMCSGIKSNFGDNLENCATNIRMAENVCRVLAERPVKRFIFFSSIAVYGVFKQDTQITEQTPCEPDTYYGISKFTSERLFDLTFSRMPASSLVHVRTPTIYGPGERIRAATPSGFLSTYLAGDNVTIWGDGSEFREFIFIDDIVRVIDALLFSDYSGILNTSSGGGCSYREVLDCITGILGRKLTVHSRERSKPKVDKVYDTALFRKLFPEFEFTPLEQGLRAILAAQKAEIAA